jgi:hypothetical protein
MVVNGVGILPAPTPRMEWWRGEILLHWRSLSKEECANSIWRASNNDTWWVQFFDARRDEELHNTEWLIGPPSSCNREGCAHF